MPNAFCHIELNTTDVDAAKKFYTNVFDWKLQDTGGPMHYTMIDVGKGTAGGMQTKMMPDVPNHWLAYVEVADVRKTMEKARKAGAQIVLEYQEIGDMGSIGIFVDPQGAGLGVWARAPKPAAKPTAKKPAKKAAAKKAKKAAKPAKKAAKKRK